MIKTEVNSDLRGQSILTKISAVKGDTDRQIRVYLRDGGKPYPIAAGSYAVLMGKKPDGTAVFNNCRIESNVILYDFTDQTCAVEGSYPVQIKLYGPDQKTITTVPIQIDVYGTEFDAEAAAASADEQTALDDLVNRTRALQLEIIHDRDTGAYQGESAYDIAVRLGFQGNEAEWIDSLRYDHSQEFIALAEQVRKDVTVVSGHASDANTKAGQAAESAQIAQRWAEQAAEKVKSMDEQVTAAENASANALAQAKEAIRQVEIAAEQVQAAKGEAGTASAAAEQARMQALKAAESAAAADSAADTARKEADKSVAMGMHSVQPGQIPVADEVDTNGVVKKWRAENMPSGENKDFSPFKDILEYTTIKDSGTVEFTTAQFPLIKGQKQLMVTMAMPYAAETSASAYLYLGENKVYGPAVMSLFGGLDNQKCFMFFVDASTGLFLTYGAMQKEYSWSFPLSPNFNVSGNFSLRPQPYKSYDSIKLSFKLIPEGTIIKVIGRK